MSWELKSDRPVYIQLIEQIQLRIVSGIYAAGGQLPSVRELAAEASVNPNTMQKALSELERSGLVYSKRTSGRFITDDKGLIAKIRRQLAEEQAEMFMESMRHLGFSDEEIIDFVTEQLKEK